jgi:hypothetical protein
MQLTVVGTKRPPIIDEGPKYLRGQLLEQLTVGNSLDQCNEVRFNLSPILMVQSDLRPFV